EARKETLDDFGARVEPRDRSRERLGVVAQEIPKSLGRLAERLGRLPELAEEGLGPLTKRAGQLLEVAERGDEIAIAAHGLDDLEDLRRDLAPFIEHEVEIGRDVAERRCRLAGERLVRGENGARSIRALLDEDAQASGDALVDAHARRFADEVSIARRQIGRYAQSSRARRCRSLLRASDLDIA